MRIKLPRSILPVICATALAAAPASAGAVTVGIADSGTSYFTNPLFTALNIHQARDVVVWNAAVLNGGDLAGARAWIDAAQAVHVTPLISFAGNGNYIPTVKQYTAAVKAFIHDFPSVKLYTAWNEPDWIYRSLSKNPKLAAEFDNALVAACKGCTVAAGDLYLAAPQLGTWIKSYERYLKPRPKAWALHPYNDVRTLKTSQIQTLMKLTSGQVWLDEISGVERRGHWPYPNQSVTAAAKDEQFLFALPKRFPRITRIYHYQWQDNPGVGWDSGLLDPNGKPRPAYYVLQKAAK